MKNKTTIQLLFLTFVLMNVGCALTSQNQEYVDLGLPSGTLWATCNVGADNPWDYGDYFAWGETETKDSYSWSNYQHGNENESKKYNKTDNKTTLEEIDDVACQKWGKDWCMPTQAQFQELCDNITSVWTNDYQGKGVAGRFFISKKNGKKIFFPAAGYKKSDGKATDAGSCGNYWSSSLNADLLIRAQGFGFISDYAGTGGWVERYAGFPVRPVRCKN